MSTVQVRRTRPASFVLGCVCTGVIIVSIQLINPANSEPPPAAAPRESRPSNHVGHPEQAGLVDLFDALEKRVKQLEGRGPLCVSANTPAKTNSKEWATLPDMTLNCTTEANDLTLLVTLQIDDLGVAFPAPAPGIPVPPPPVLTNAQFRVLVDDEPKSELTRFARQNGPLILSYMGKAKAGMHSIRVEWRLAVEPSPNEKWFFYVSSPGDKKPGVPRSLTVFILH
jgi:hypothetical protein